MSLAGSPLVADLSGRVRMLSGGRQLQISILPVDFLYRVSFSFIVRPTILNSGSHPSEVVITQGNEISLECKVQGIPEPAITWMKDGRPLAAGRDVAILQGGRFLQLRSARVSDTGRYVCVAANAAGLSDRKYDLNVHGEYVQNGAGVTEGVSTFKFTPGHLRRNPVPQITWIKDGQSLTEDEDHKFLSSGRFLQITNAQVTDTGRYTCIASNTAGDKSKSYSLNVLEDVTVILNSPTSLVCEAYSYPPATITWLKDGNPLESNRNIRILPGKIFDCF
uniref:Ig-like domain-containing protein n=1 Tax=Otus sunia TaxID=257818 RepID=A0A8C8ED54_9STRI